MEIADTKSEWDLYFSVHFNGLNPGAKTASLTLNPRALNYGIINEKVVP
jgi:hypothetical protein